MKKKTAKLQKLENNRFSILTEDFTHCFLCGSSPVDIHEVYGGANRQNSMKHGFCVPLCRHHHQTTHDDIILSTGLKKVCQSKYERTHSRAEFMSIIGKNYLQE